MGPSPEVIVVVGGIAVLAALGVLYALASSIRNAVATHDLRVRALTLRNERIAYLREQHSGEATVTGLTLPGVNAASPSQQEQTVGKPTPTGKKKH